MHRLPPRCFAQGSRGAERRTQGAGRPRPTLAAFRALLSNQEDEEGLEESSLPALRRGNRIMDDAASSGSESEDDAGAPDPPSEVKWNLPAGFGFTLAW